MDGYGARLLLGRELVFQRADAEETHADLPIGPPSPVKKHPTAFAQTFVKESGEASHGVPIDGIFYLKLAIPMIYAAGAFQLACKHFYVIRILPQKGLKTLISLIGRFPFRHQAKTRL